MDVSRWLIKRASILALVVAFAALLPASAEAALNPELSGAVSNSESLSGVVAVAVAGHYAYVPGYYAGKVTAIDISNPAAPVVAGSSEASNELLDATTINIAGGYAYVVSKNRNGPEGSHSNDDGTGNSLTILDIASNPAEPTIVGSIREANTLFGAYGVAISGNYAYVASQGCLSGQPCPVSSVGNSFAVIDVSNPASPSIVARIDSSPLPAPWEGTGALQHATAVAISGNYAYVTAAYSDRLTVVSIANPLSPQIVATLKDTTNLNFPVDVAVSGHYAYVADQVSPGRLTVVDVSNPTDPQVVASLANASLTGAYRVRVRGDFAYVSASSAEDVAVVDISNPLSPRLAATVTASGDLRFTTGLDLDASGAHLVASSPQLSTQKQPLYPPFALQPGGPTMTGTLSAITLDPLPIEATIATESEPANPTAQTSASFDFSVNDAVAAVQCRLDSGPWAPCTTPTSQSYTGLSVGLHSFQVQATDSAANTNTATYSWTVTAPPTNMTAPAIAGSAAQGQLLTASAGGWSGYPAPSFAYQWERCGASGGSCVAIEGASQPTYRVAAADAGSTLAVAVTATNVSGAASAESPPTAVVTAPPTNMTAPAIAGSAAQGQLLTASAGGWSGYPAPSFAYQWERCGASGGSCVAISGATGSSYTALSTDAGSTLVVTVTATNVSGSASAESPPTAVVTAPAATVMAAPAGGDLGGSGIGGGGILGINAAVPTTAQIQAALLGALLPGGKAGLIASVRRHRGYQVRFNAPARGEVVISWYELPKGAHLAGAKSVLVASGRATATAKGELKLMLELTPRGKSLLEHGHQLKLTGKGVFTPTGGSPVTVIKPFTLR